MQTLRLSAETLIAQCRRMFERLGKTRLAGRDDLRVDLEIPFGNTSRNTDGFIEMFLNGAISLMELEQLVAFGIGRDQLIDGFERYARNYGLLEDRVWKLLIQIIDSVQKGIGVSDLVWGQIVFCLENSIVPITRNRK